MRKNLRFFNHLDYLSVKRKIKLENELELEMRRDYRDDFAHCDSV